MRGRSLERESTRRGRAVVELVAVLLMLSLAGAASIPRGLDRPAADRDAQRLRDLRAIQAAIERFREDHGHAPPPRPSDVYGGWDVSHDGDFLPALEAGGYLERVPVDPRNGAAFHYRYYRYASGSYGCSSAGDYYVLGAVRLETAVEVPRAPVACPDRDWGREFAVVLGGGSGLGP